MKKLGLYFAAVAWWWIVLYLVGAFVSASFDPMEWTLHLRMLLGIFAFGITLAAAAATTL